MLSIQFMSFASLIIVVVVVVAAAALARFAEHECKGLQGMEENAAEHSSIL